MNLSFLHLKALNQNDEQDEHALFIDHEPHTDEGSEFLDDLIRMVDLPLIKPEMP